LSLGLTGTFDVESQASTPSKIPRIALDDSFSLYSHVEDQQEKSPTFLELDMAGQIKEIVKKTRAKREQTRNETSKIIPTSPASETSKIISISPLKSRHEEDENDKKSFVSFSSSEESESLKESAADDEFLVETSAKQTKGLISRKAMRCLVIVVAMVVGAAAAVLYGMGVLHLEKGELPSSTIGQDGGTLSPTAPQLLSLADKLEIKEFDMVLAHIQASLEWMIQNDSAEFTDSLNALELEERFALIALYMGTSSEGFSAESDWKGNHGFLTPDVSVCEWNFGGFGVFCDAEGRVIEVYLGMCRMFTA
jgi:hypothetical protein